MAACWKTRECEPDMRKDCMHAVTDYDMCPMRCFFATCDRPTHVLTSDPELVFDPTIDRDQAIKQSCIYCEFFLKNGPRVGATSSEEAEKGAE